MKKGWILLPMLFLISFASMEGQANPEVRKASPAVYVDPELPFRCHAPNQEKQVSSTIVLSQDDFVFLPRDAGDMLPRYAVNGYTFTDAPVSQVLEGLLKSAGIKVVAPAGEFIHLDGKKIRGELAAVVQQLTDSADVFYNYRASTKTLTVLRRAEFALSVPKNKVVLMAVLDGLRGSQITDLDVDWENYQIRMKVSFDELQKAKSLVKQILDDSYLLASDIQGYQVVPMGNSAGWQGVFNDMSRSLSSSNRALVGRSVVLSSRAMVEDFLKTTKRFYEVTPIVAGEAVVPNGWQMRFDVNECSNYTLPYPNLSILMKAKIKNHNDLRTKISLHTASGTLTTFDVKSVLNQEVALVGIPAQRGNAELMFLLRFNLIRFVQKGEQND